MNRHRWIAVAARVRALAVPRRLWRPLAASAVAGSMLVSVGVGTASASQSSSRPAVATCWGGNIHTGTYRGLAIAGNCTVPAGNTVVVRGNLVVQNGAYFNAFTMGTVIVTGNVYVGRRAVLALGCTLASKPPPTPCTGTTRDVVAGSILADHPLTMYLDGDTIYGEVISKGGGPGLTLNPYVNFPIKDNVIYGYVQVSHWTGAWFGFIRNVTYGDVVINHNIGLARGDNGKLDSNEVVTNRIRGDLACYGNVPAAQIGDSGGTLNVVRGQKLGQCARL